MEPVHEPFIPYEITTAHKLTFDFNDIWVTNPLQMEVYKLL
jgi:hypothetical protein